jgi:hypothetical protein
MHLEKYRKGRYWAVYSNDGALICLTVYRKGAREVVRRLQALAPGPEGRGALHTGAQESPQPTTLTAATRRRWRRALAIASIIF